MPDNAPFHVSKFTCDFFEPKRFTIEKIIKWSPSIPELNRIENIYSIVKMKLYESGNLNNSTVDLWEAIKTILSGIEVAEV